MSILDKLTEDMKVALKEGEKDRLSAIRMMRGQLKNEALDKRSDLTEEEEIAVLTSAAKKRRESIEAYQAAGRDDLVKKEQQELDVIQSYLPQPLSEQELTEIIDQVIAETGAVTMKDIGKVMPAVMERVRGRADGKTINQLVRQKLS